MKYVTFNADISEYFLQYLHGCQFKIHMDIKADQVDLCLTSKGVLHNLFILLFKKYFFLAFNIEWFQNIN